MKKLHVLTLAALAGLTMLTSGCAVMRGQENMSNYVDDKSIQASIKTKLIEDKTTGGLSIGVASLHGTVELTGYAKSQAEKDRAGWLARNTQGVHDVHNDLLVRP